MACAAGLVQELLLVQLLGRLRQPLCTSICAVVHGCHGKGSPSSSLVVRLHGIEQLDLPIADQNFVCAFLEQKQDMPQHSNSSFQRTLKHQSQQRLSGSIQHTGISRLSLLMRTSCSNICSTHYEACRNCGARRLKGAFVGI